MPQSVLELLKDGLDANNEDKFRQENIILLPPKGTLVAAGDIHGHKRNLERIINFADLENNPDRHLMFQEIIHGGPQDQQGGCISYKVLFEAIEYKLKFPHQVHFIIGNHDTAVINNSEVMKNGVEMNQSMRMALQREFEENADEIELALRQFLFSQPLAIKTETRIWLSHSLPADRFLDQFDHQVFNRKLKVNDTVKPGSVYLLTWGRKQSQQTLDTLASLFDVDIFILGHQPQKEGWGQVGQNLLIIASDHNHGCLLPIDLKKSYNIQQLIDSIVPLASIL